MKFLFAWRYFRSKKSTNAINIIAWISVLAIAVGTAALIIVLSVFNGFEGLVKSLYGSFYADIKVSSAKEKFFSLPYDRIGVIRDMPGVAQMSFVVEEKAVLVNGEYNSIVYLKGVDRNFTNVNPVDTSAKRGKYNLGNAQEPDLYVGIGIENALGVDPESPLGSQTTIYLPDRKAKSFRSVEEGLHSFNADVTGSFMIQQDFDNKYAFTNLAFMQYMLDLKPDQYSALEIRASDPSKAEEIKKKLQATLGDKFVVKTRLEQNQSLFSVMQMEKWFIYAVLSLILVVAAFNMIGALALLVLEKQKDIAVLRAMGADDSLIQGIFLSEGFVLSGIGGGIGMLLAFIICTLQQKFHLIKLEGNTFIIDYYPVSMSFTDFLLIAFTICAVSVMAAWFPAKKSATQQFSLKS